MLKEMLLLLKDITSATIGHKDCHWWDKNFLTFKDFSTDAINLEKEGLGRAENFKT